MRSSRDKHVPFVWFCRRLPQQFLRALSNRRLVAEIPAKCTYEITRGLLERFGAKEGRRVAQLDFEMTVTRPKGFSFFSAAYEGTQAILRSSRFERNNYWSHDASAIGQCRLAGLFSESSRNPLTGRLDGDSDASLFWGRVSLGSFELCCCGRYHCRCCLCSFHWSFVVSPSWRDAWVSRKTGWLRGRAAFGLDLCCGSMTFLVCDAHLTFFLWWVVDVLCFC